MRYINLHFTYLLTYSEYLQISDVLHSLMLKRVQNELYWNVIESLLYIFVSHEFDWLLNIACSIGTMQ